MSALEPDYDSDPGRRQAWVAPRDVHEVVAIELDGRVLDAGCGEGRLAPRVGAGTQWIGVDASVGQLAHCTARPVVLADIRALPFADASFDAVAHLWCLYHLAEPRDAIAEARRVLRHGGRYFACTAARGNDPELMPEGYPPTSFDAEDAAAIIQSVFPDASREDWDGRFYALESREEVRAYCRHHFIPAGRAGEVELPLWLTKRGTLVRATKG